MQSLTQDRTAKVVHIKIETRYPELLMLASSFAHQEAGSSQKSQQSGLGLLVENYLRERGYIQGDN